MSHQTPRRRTRTIFHYKVDEVLRSEDRENYLALAREPRMRNEDAHAWLLGRGYRLSLSAVARHRRRLIAGDARRRAELRQTKMVAQFLGGPNAPDFAAATAVQIQHMVFQHLLQLDDAPRPTDQASEDESPKGDVRALPRVREVDTAELLRVIKLVSQSVNLTAAHVRRELAEKAAAQSQAPRDDATLRKDIEDILAGRK